MSNNNIHFVHKIFNESQEELDKISKQILNLKNQEKLVKNKRIDNMTEAGKRISLCDLSVQIPCFKYLTFGSIIANGFANDDINKNSLEALFNTLDYSENTLDYNEECKTAFLNAIKNSFYNLSDENKLTFCLFVPDFVKKVPYSVYPTFIYPNFIRFPLSFVTDYLLDQYSTSTNKNNQEDNLFDLVLAKSEFDHPEKDLMKNQLFFKIAITEKNILNLTKTKGILKQLSNNGYNNGLYFNESLHIDPATKQKLLDIVK